MPSSEHFRYNQIIELHSQHGIEGADFKQISHDDDYSGVVFVSSLSIRPICLKLLILLLIDWKLSKRGIGFYRRFTISISLTLSILAENKYSTETGSFTVDDEPVIISVMIFHRLWFFNIFHHTLNDVTENSVHSWGKVLFVNCGRFFINNIW